MKANKWKFKPTNSEVLSCLKRFKECFPNSYLNELDELIVEPENNIYFGMKDIENETQFNCKVVEWLSRPAHKGLSEWWQRRIRSGMNKFLGTKFTCEDLNTIYTFLGCQCNRARTVDFVNSGYDVSTLKRVDSER